MAAVAKALPAGAKSNTSDRMGGGGGFGGMGIGVPAR